MREDRDEAMIKSLREEAWQVKHCFTQYSIQAMAFSSAVLVGIASLQKDRPFVALCSIPLIGVLLAVIRIGTHKYGTANRIYGYLLHLERTRGLRETGDGRADFMRGLGWEEAMRAWRVVQTTVFQAVYASAPWKWNVLKRPFRRSREKWFEPASLVQPEAGWHSGRYLENTLIVLHSLCLVAMTPLLFLLYHLAQGASFWTRVWRPWQAGWRFVGVEGLIAAIATLIVFRWGKTYYRRKALEDGLLCINSCAMMWHAVVVAHHRALLALPPCTGACVDDYEGYTRELSRCALHLARELVSEAERHRRCTTSFHDWIRRNDAACRAGCLVPVRGVVNARGLCLLQDVRGGLAGDAERARRADARTERPTDGAGRWR